MTRRNKSREEERRIFKNWENNNSRIEWRSNIYEGVGREKEKWA